MRTAAFSTKTTKDLEQAECLFQLLATERPGDLVLAFEAAEGMGAGFLKRVRAGLEQLSEETRRAIRGFA